MNSTKETLNNLLVTLFNHVLFLEEKHLKKEGVALSMNEVHVLDAINNSTSKTMGDVAKKLHITLGTLTVSTKKLEAKGYITKQKDLEDKRIVRVYLTNQAQDIIRIHYNFHSKMIDALTQNLTTEEDLMLIKSLDKVTTFFEENY